MKKLKLSLDGAKMLSKDQMKKIVGGGYCSITCDAFTEYACCSDDPGFPVCLCISNGSPYYLGNCDYGGPGSWACTIFM